MARGEKGAGLEGTGTPSRRDQKSSRPPREGRQPGSCELAATFGGITWIDFIDMARARTTGDGGDEDAAGKGTRAGDFARRRSPARGSRSSGSSNDPPPDR